MINLQEATYNLLYPIAQAMPLGGPLPLIHAYQNSGRVVKPYAAIRIDTIAVPAHEHHFPVRESGYQDIGGWRRATVEVQVYGRNAGACARYFMLALATNTSVENQVRLNVSVGNRLLLTEIPELLNSSQYEQRGIYQFEMFFSEQMDDNVGLIEKVEIGYKPNPGDGGAIDGDGNAVWPYDEYCFPAVEAFPPYSPPTPTP